MSDQPEPTRRRVLSGLVAVGTATVAGCSGGSGSNACSTATEFVRLWLTEEFEQAATYYPYEHLPELTKQQVIQNLRGLYGLAASPEFRSVSCACSTSVSTADYRRIADVREDITLSDVQAVRLSVTLVNDGREQTATWYAAVYRVNDDGPFVSPKISDQRKQQLQSVADGC